MLLYKLSSQLLSHIEGYRTKFTKPQLQTKLKWNKSDIKVITSQYVIGERLHIFLRAVLCKKPALL